MYYLSPACLAMRVEREIAGSEVLRGPIIG